MIDTHAHIYSEKFEEDRSEMLDRAFAIGVNKILMPNVDSTSIDGMLRLEDEYPEKCFSMMGLHPCYVKDNVEQELELVENWLTKRKFIAVGEIGLDFYWDLTYKVQQFYAFKRQLKLANQFSLPVAIHMRDSIDETLKVLESFSETNGVLHCFSGNLEQAKKAVELGFMLGIGGVVTFKKSELPIVLKEIPIENIILETDCPYLAPVPYRGKRNEPAYVAHVAEKIADIKSIPLLEVIDITNQNAASLFKLNQ